MLGVAFLDSRLPHGAKDPTATVDSYDAVGQIVSRVSHPSSIETLTELYTYDTNGDRTSVSDARGNRTDYCYDVSYAGVAISGSRGNLTRQIGPAPTAGANRPVTLITFDSHNNVTQSVAPMGVPSGATVTCATNLSSINTAFATDFGFDASGAKLLSQTTRFTDPDSGLKTAITKYEFGDAANPGLNPNDPATWEHGRDARLHLRDHVIASRYLRDTGSGCVTG